MRAVSHSRAGLLAVGVVGGAVGLYFLLRSPTPDLLTWVSVRPWFDDNSETWQQFTFADVEDQDKLAEAVSSWVEGLAVIGDIPGGHDALVRDAAGFLHNLSANSAAQYIERVGHERSLRTDLETDIYVQGQYRRLTGKTMPRGMSADRVLDTFWRGHPQAVGRPKSVSFEAVSSAAETVPGVDANQAFLEVQGEYVKHLTEDELARYLEVWECPISQGFVRLTAPKTSLERVLSNHGTTEVFYVRCVAEVSGGDHVMLSIFMYWSPDDSRWYVRSASSGHWTAPFWVF